ncbi:unnamed protein product [Angiostrongylus costaricensis]|uniref:SWIM-type domain-containing protein n=1 Tax=Angiostrongylus costaricensis TaxID=334426 RepID=A0A0R3P9P8_ANGCS|nr:unnamed protein product [Angiostrongylus costaricensis]
MLYPLCLASRSVSSLSDLSARVCARQMSFVELERNYRDISRWFWKLCISEIPVAHSLPDKLFLSIVYWCFPATADDIRLYSCLANGNADEFNHGGSLYQTGAVRDVVQIGMFKESHVGPILEISFMFWYTMLSFIYYFFHVRSFFFRCRIVSCDCSCASKSAWCQHVVAVCLYRIHQPNEVQFRVTIWDSVNELSMAKLKKFAQYLVNELPKEYLPVAQRLLDQLKCSESEINRSPGAPDPTDGGHEKVRLHTSIRRLLIKYCVPAPTVHCDVQYLGTAQHPIAAEWLTIMKSLRAREPEGIWNLMAIVREMFARRDENAVSLLSILTVECLANCQVLLWWYVTKLVQGGNWFQQTTVSSQISAQLNCAQLCDEIVTLWRCAVLNPMLSPQNRRQFIDYLVFLHLVFLNITHINVAALLLNSIQDVKGCSLSINNAHFGLQQFPGFHPCLQVLFAYFFLYSL